MMEQAEELMLIATTGKSLPEGLQIRDLPPHRPQALSHLNLAGFFEQS